ncbi:MAG: ABC transporter ATP-binding protein [Treponema sp.]|jgi:iron complex transport system ATP-binding protein|nr:ABC transporter ATP-binding protein [Treponema sp.]
MLELLELQELSVGYKNKTIIKDINIAIRGGELITIIGPNGAGKTTLLRTIAGLRSPLSGHVFIDGKDPGKMKPQKRAELVSFLFQGNGLQGGFADWSFTVREMVAQGRFHQRGFWGRETKADNEAVEKALAEADALHVAEKPITELSGGEFQRVLIARTMAQDARVILLDEPVHNLDPKYAFLVMELIKKLTRQGAVALVTLHDLSLVTLYADRVGVAAHGSFLLGSPEDMMKEDSLEKVFDMKGVFGNRASCKA